MDVDATMKQNFVYRMLFRDIYWRCFYVLFSLVHFSTAYAVYFSFAISMLHVRLSYAIKVLLTYLLT